MFSVSVLIVMFLRFKYALRMRCDIGIRVVPEVSWGTLGGDLLVCGGARCPRGVVNPSCFRGFRLAIAKTHYKWDNAMSQIKRIQNVDKLNRAELHKNELNTFEME